MMTEVNLIEKTLAGETEAFGQLILQYQNQVYRLIYRIVGNSEDASDIAQEVFIKAYQNLGKLKEQHKFQGWLMKIATNECYSWIRKRQDNLFSLEQEVIETRAWHLPAAPDELIIKEELYKRVMSAISELPEKDKKVIELFYLEEKSYQEIQQQLGISKSALGWRLSKARAKLRQKLQTAYYGIAFWRHFQWRRIAELANVKFSSMSVATFFFISLALHIVVIMTISNVYNGKGYNQGHGDIHEGGLVKTVLLTSSNSEPDKLDSYPALPAQAGQNDFGERTTKPDIIATSIIPIEQPLPKSISALSLHANNVSLLKLLVQNKTALSFDVAAIIESPANKDVIETIPYNKPSQFQKTERTQFGQGFQNQTDSLVLMDVNAQVTTPSSDDTSLADIELEETPTRILKGHKNGITDVTFSPDGRLLASASRDSTIRLWDMETGKVSILSGHKGAVGRLAFSPDGKWLASSSLWAREIFLWDVAERKIAKFLARRSANDLSFSPDGKLLAVLSANKVLFWDMFPPLTDAFGLRTTLKKLHQLGNVYKHYILLETLSTKYGRAMAFSPNGEILAVGTMMGTVDLWDLEERELLLTLVGYNTGPGQSIWKIQFSPDGKSLAASYIKENVNLWELETGQLKYSFIAFQKHTGEVAFSADSSLLASGRNPVKLWDVDTGQIVKMFKGSQPIAFSPDGKWLASSFENNTIALWELNSVHIENVQQISLGQSENLTLSKIVFISDRDAEAEVENNIYIMDSDGSNQVILATPPENARSVGGLSVSPHGEKIAFHATDSSGNVDIWVMDADGQNPEQLTFGYEVDSNPAWSPDGERIVFESGLPKEMNICVMNADGTNIITLVNNGAENLEPDWSPDGKKIAFSSDYEEREKVRNIYILDVESKKLLKLTHNAGMRQQSRQPAWSPDGKYIAYVSGKYTAFTSRRSREWWRQRPSALFIMDADGKNRRRLIDDAICPVWSKGGKSIIFASDVDGDDEIYAIDSDGNSLINLTQNNERDSEPDCFVPPLSNNL